MFISVCGSDRDRSSSSSHWESRKQPMYIYLWIHTYIHMHIYIYIYIHHHTHTHTPLLSHRDRASSSNRWASRTQPICIYVCKNKPIDIHTHTLTHIHTITHTHTSLSLYIYILSHRDRASSSNRWASRTQPIYIYVFKNKPIPTHPPTHTHTHHHTHTHIPLSLSLYIYYLTVIERVLPVAQRRVHGRQVGVQLGRVGRGPRRVERDCLLVSNLVEGLRLLGQYPFVYRSTSTSVSISLLSRRREHLQARALQIRAELSTHIHRETGPQRPTHSFWSFLFEKTKLEREQSSGRGPPGRVCMWSRVRARICIQGPRRVKRNRLLVSDLLEGLTLDVSSG